MLFSLNWTYLNLGNWLCEVPKGLRNRAILPVLNDVAAVEANEVETQANRRIPEQCHCIDSVQGVRQTMDGGGGSKVIVPRTQGA